MMSKNSFNAKKNLEVAGKSYEIFDISGIEGATSLPFSLKVLLENLLRTEDGANITADHIKALANWNPAAEPDTEIQFTPARVVMQDFTGVPCIVDLATMREAIVDLGGDPSFLAQKILLSKILILNMSATKSVIAFYAGAKLPLMSSR
jgi:aconitate hydratase